MGCSRASPPTLILNSGWGYHIHWALTPEAGTHKVQCSAVAKGIIAQANKLCEEAARGFRPSCEIPSAWDNTFDVGARLARYPGTLNNKAHRAGVDPRRVTIEYSSDTRLDPAQLTKLADALCQGWVQPEVQEEDIPNVPPAQSGSPTASDVDFRQQSLADGRSWQTIINMMSPGEKFKVVCPFGGTSLGSGFFAKDAQGKPRYYSGPTRTTYWNTYIKPSGAEVVPLRRNTRGAIVNSWSNLEKLLEQDGDLDFWYNAWSEREMNGADEVGDTMWSYIQLHMEQKYAWHWSVPHTRLQNLISLVAQRHRRNPVVDYLDSLSWDGVERLNTWIHRACRAPDTELHRAYSRAWAISLIARARDPGCKVDTCLVLTGQQGFGKSQLFAAWVDIPGIPGLFSDTPMDLKNKDSYLQLYSCWVYEDAELAATGVAGAEAKKAFLSSSTDRVRPPYGRTVREFKRHTVIVGTTNDREVLRDRTGSRRFWVVQVPAGDRRADLAWLRRNRAQLLAEAQHYYRNGERWWLHGRIDAIREQQNESFQYRDHFSECAKVAFCANGGGWNRSNRITVAAFARAMSVGTTKVDPQRRGLSLSSALQQAGFIKRRSGGLSYYYRRGSQQCKSNGLTELTRWLVNDHPVVINNNNDTQHTDEQ